MCTFVDLTKSMMASELVAPPTIPVRAAQAPMAWNSSGGGTGPEEGQLGDQSGTPAKVRFF